MISEFKDAVHATVHKSDIPVKQLAERLGKSLSYLYNVANSNLEDFHLQGREIIPLTLASGDLTIIQYLCSGVGGTFLKVPQLGSEDLTLNEHILETIEHLADLRRTYKAAMEDGHLDRQERQELDSLKFQILTHVMSLLETLTKGGV